MLVLACSHVACAAPFVNFSPTSHRPARALYLGVISNSEMACSVYSGSRPPIPLPAKRRVLAYLSFQKCALGSG